MDKQDVMVLDKKELIAEIMVVSHLSFNEAAEALEITLERLRKEGKIE